MRGALAVLLTATLTWPGACQSRDKTVFPATEAIVLDVSSGQPVAGAEIRSDRTEEEAITDENGRFTLGPVIRNDSSIPLPASGVYRDTAVIEAHIDGARAFGPVDFISVSDTAEAPGILFMIGHEAPYARDGIPDHCELPDEAVYALQLLSVDPAPVRAVLAKNDGYTFAFEAWLDRVLVRQLPRQCDIPLNRLTRWMDEIETLTRP